MQTFMPYPDFDKSAQSLDDVRLNNQCNEATIIIKSIKGLYPVKNGRRGWEHHAAAKMWRGYVDALTMYRNACCKEWIRRGKNSKRELWEHQESPPMPPWFGREDFHRSHQSNLIRKKPEYYGIKFVGIPDDLPYLWE